MDRDTLSLLPGAINTVSAASSNNNYIMKRLLLTLLLCCSCSQQIEQHKTIPNNIDNRERWHIIAMMIKERYETDMGVKEIAAELSYQEYLLSLEKQQ